jgi:hypothetical protein
MHESLGRSLHDHGNGIHDGECCGSVGIGLPTNAAIPAVDARRYALAHMAGQRIVEMVHEDLRMSKILTRAASRMPFEL